MTKKTDSEFDNDLNVFKSFCRRPLPENSHIAIPTNNLGEWFKHPHSTDEIKAKLNVGVSGRFEDMTDTHDITDTDAADAAKYGSEVITPWEKTKLADLKSKLKELDNEDNE